MSIFCKLITPVYSHIKPETDKHTSYVVLSAITLLFSYQHPDLPGILFTTYFSTEIMVVPCFS